MMLHAEKIDDKGEKRAYRKMGRKMVPKQMGRFLGNSLTGHFSKNTLLLENYFVLDGLRRIPAGRFSPESTSRFGQIVE